MDGKGPADETRRQYGDFKILHTADSHIGAELPIRPRLSRPRRGDDFLDSFHRVIHLARTEAVNLFIHSGDLFDTPRPSARALMAAALPLRSLADDGIPIIIIPGNHERSALPQCVFLDHPHIHVVQGPTTCAFTLGGIRVAVSAMPCLRHAAAACFEQALSATGWQHVPADFRILAIHQSIDSAVCGPADFRFRRGPDVIARDVIPAAFDYVAAGHVHRHQRLLPAAGLSQHIVYAGSPDRITFAERDEPKGCVVVDCIDGGLAPRFVEHDVRPMRIHPLVATARERQRLREEIESVLAGAPPRAMLQVRLAGPVERGALRGLGIMEAAARLRPDVLLSVSYRGVEFETRDTTELAAATIATSNGSIATSSAPALVGAGESSGRTSEEGESVLRMTPLDASASCPCPAVDAPMTAATAAVSGHACRSILQDHVATDLAIDRASPARVARLPSTCGVYALYDADDRLLYVGKAADLRARVRTHLRDLKRSNFFTGWARHVARIEAVQQPSDAAATALESHLIKSHRPPFNWIK